MTMISLEVYLDNLRDLPYLELIRERDRLIGFIREYEKAEMSGPDNDPDMPADMNHGFEQVKYQMYLEYLSALCQFMQGKYNQEYVWEGRTLRQDAEEKRNGS